MLGADHEFVSHHLIFHCLYGYFLLIGVTKVEEGQIILQYSTGSSWIIKSWIFLIFNLIKAGGGQLDDLFSTERVKL